MNNLCYVCTSIIPNGEKMLVLQQVKANYNKYIGILSHFSVNGVTKMYSKSNKYCHIRCIKYLSKSELEDYDGCDSTCSCYTK